DDLAERRCGDVYVDEVGGDHVHAVLEAFRVLEEQVPAGQDDDVHAWPVPLARLCDLKAVEPWHGEIGQHDVEGAPAKGLTAKPRPWSASRTSSRKSRASSANNTRSLGLGSVTKPPRGMTWTEHQRGDRLPPGVSEGGSPCYPSPEETVHDDEPRRLAAHARGAIRGPHARLGRL